MQIQKPTDQAGIREGKDGAGMADDEGAIRKP